jgi:hypothetical protein
MSDDAHTQAVVVAVLARLGPASVAAVAHEAGIDEATARRALRVLERARIASRPRSHGPWSLVGGVVQAVAAGPVPAGALVYQRADGAVAAATKAESNERRLDLARVPTSATSADRASTGKKPTPWWHGNPSTRSWWERKRMRDKQLRESVQKMDEKCAKNEQ